MQNVMELRDRVMLNADGDVRNEIGEMCDAIAELQRDLRRLQATIDSKPRPRIEDQMGAPEMQLELERAKQSSIKGFGQIAYDAYCACSGGKSLVSGASLPPYHELTIEIRTAWEQAAKAVLSEQQRCDPY